MLEFITIESTSGGSGLWATYMYYHKSLREALEYAARFNQSQAEYEEYNTRCSHSIEVHIVDADMHRIEWGQASIKYNLDQDTTSWPDEVDRSIVRSIALLSF